VLEESGMHKGKGKRPRGDDAAIALRFTSCFVKVKPVELIQATAVVLNLALSQGAWRGFKQDLSDTSLEFCLSVQSGFHGMRRFSSRADIYQWCVRA